MAAGAAEHPRFGVQARGLGVVRHLDLRATRHQPIERFPFGGSCEYGCDNAQSPARPAMRLELTFEQPQSMPPHKGAQQVDGVGRGDLVGEGVGEARLPARINQEV